MFNRKKLKEERKSRKYSHNMLAAELYNKVGLSVTPQTLVNWEHKTEPTIPKLELLADFFGVHYSHFMIDKKGGKQRVH